MSCFYVLRESDFLRDFQSQSYPWSSNCLENFSEILENSWISIKVKNFKTFSSPNQRASLRKFLVPLPDKSFLLLWNKGFLMEIYKNIQTFAFEVLRKCSSWASRNDAVQMFFSDTNQKQFAGKLSELRFAKWARFFEGICIASWVIFFDCFCLFWDFLPENLKLIDKLQIWGFE